MFGLVPGSSALLVAGLSASDAAPRPLPDPFPPARVDEVNGSLNYHKLAIRRFGALDGIHDDQGKAAEDCRRKTIDYLTEKQIFATIHEANVRLDGPDLDADTLTVDADVQELRTDGRTAVDWRMTLAVTAMNSNGAILGRRNVSATADNKTGDRSSSTRGLPERLTAIADGVETCKSNNTTGTAQVVVIFAPTGAAQSAALKFGSPFDGTATGKCVEERFRQAKVPPFDGSPVSVMKSFTIE